MEYGMLPGIGEQITSVKPDPRRPERVRVRVGRAYGVTLPVEVAHGLGLAAGVAWTRELAAKVDAAHERDQAKQMTLRWLSLKPRSRGELASKLRQRGIGAEVSASVLEDLERVGLVDDEEFARLAARQEVSRRGAGKRLIEAKLRQKGVAGDAASRAAGEALKGRDLVEDALRLAEKKVRASGARLERAVLERRIYGMLARRGFEADVCRAATARALVGVGEGEG